MPVTINGTTGIANDGGYTGDGVVFADTTPANTLVTTTSGNVGIGTSSPLTKFTVSGGYISQTDGTVRTYLGADGSGGALVGTTTNQYLRFITNDTERARIDSSGNLGIGTSSPSAKLHVYDTSATSYINSRVQGDNVIFNMAVGNSNVGTASFRNLAYLGTQNSYPLAFVTGDTERARIDSSGYLWIKSTGGTSPWDATSGTYAKFGDIYPIGATAQSSIVAIFNRNTTTGPLIECKYNGSVVGSISVTGSNTSYNTSSDYRLKHDIQPMTGALAKVQQLKPVTYKWNADNSADEGFIAHELQEVCPSAVTGEKDAVDAEGNPQYQGIDTSFLVATLTAAIQELKAIVDAQGAEIAALKGTA